MDVNCAECSVIEDVVCPECRGGNIVKDPARGEVVCGDCGLVIEDHLIDQGPEWRAYESKELNKKARTGSPSSLIIHDKGLSTMIDWHDQDIFGKKLPPKKRAQIYRLRRWQIRSRVHSSLARNLSKAMSELDRLASQMELPKNIKERAALIYRKAIKGDYIKGKKIGATVAASIYAACRLHKIPRTLEEITRYAKVSKKELARNYRFIIESLKLKIPLMEGSDYVSRFSEELQLSPHIQKEACRILELARKKELTTGKDPKGLAAAALYITGVMEGERRTQRDIARVSHVTEVTIRNRYKEIVKALNLKLDL
ncbi:MAG: transcription initiation factor IIB [Candidatus Helarchaeota archaeon]|nr:transcription initiation factor IIB [Candidatus Helarchaeota archaeon]